MAIVGVVGGSGYTGAELLRLGHAHPDLDVAWATGDSQAGLVVGDLYPSLGPAYPDVEFRRFQPAMAADVELIFLALPHGESQRIVGDLLDRGVMVVDLAADFRLKDPADYTQWYGAPHAAPDLIDRFVYGLPEINRSVIPGSRSVAAAGCYPTAAALALAPLVEAGVIETTGVIVDAASGVSGAGRAPKATSHFGAVNENFCAYGLLDHRHTPEIEQATGATVLFTPHLAPMTRGILATCYARPAAEVSSESLCELLRQAYEGEPFVTVVDNPSTKSTWGSNSAHLTARFDERTGWVMVIAAIDNLVKGASGQAVQCANLMLGLPETAGLSAVGIYP